MRLRLLPHKVMGRRTRKRVVVTIAWDRNLYITSGTAL